MQLAAPPDLTAPDFSKMEAQITQASTLLAMISHPARLRILCALTPGELPVQRLVDASGLSQPAVSHHLRKLREADLVATRRQAQSILYRLNGTEVQAILATLHALYCDPAADHG